MERRYDEGVLAGEANKALEIDKRRKVAVMDADTICKMTGVKKEEIERN